MGTCGSAEEKKESKQPVSKKEAEKVEARKEEEEIKKLDEEIKKEEEDDGQGKSRDLAPGKKIGRRNAQKGAGKIGGDFHEVAQKHCKADVYMISGCDDAQTSKDVSDVQNFELPDDAGPAGAGGACTTAILDIIHRHDDRLEASQREAENEGLPPPREEPWTWCELLENVRAYLHHKGYKQRPQLSCSHPIDLKTPFGSVVLDQKPEAGGKKKALFMGINYTSQEKGKLDGCCNDVLRWIHYVTKEVDEPFEAEEGNMRILVDPVDYDGFKDERFKHVKVTPQEPSKKNILDCLDWLAQSEPGDLLFLHFSGHGTQVPDLDGDEGEDGMDEAIVPMDFRKTGVITDDVIFDRLLKNMKKGVKLLAVMDCCHSGSVMDLPYEWAPKEEDLDAVYEERVMEPNAGFMGFLGKMKFW